MIRHNSRQIMKLIERRCGLSVLSLAVIAGGIGLVLISLPSEGQTAKSLSEADIKKIDDVTQTAVNAALARDFATWASLFLDDAVVNPPNELERVIRESFRFLKCRIIWHSLERVLPPR